MPVWTPSVEWSPPADAFVIGGGPSLAGFPWHRLRGRKTIGCNSAFLLGADVCGLCFFSDVTWHAVFEEQLRGYAGRVVTHAPEMRCEPPAGVLVCERRVEGLHKDALGYGGNSGCSAVNLALILGAQRVFLLGFDCQTTQGRTHWHDRVIESTHDSVYDKFLDGWRALASDLPVVFPGRRVFNCTPGSRIPFFPRRSIEQFL